MENPYKAPTTPLKDTPPGPRSPILAVLAGLAVDIGGTMAASIVIGVVYVVTLARQGMDADEVRAAFAAMDPSSGFAIAGLVVGGAFSLLGGYVCARIARRGERRFATIQALLVVAFGLATGGSTYSAWIHVGLIAATFASVVLGGELGRRRNVANAREAGAATAA